MIPIRIREIGVALGERELTHEELATELDSNVADVAAALGQMIVYGTTKSRLELAREAAQRCLTKAGVSIDEVDGLLSCRGRTIATCEMPLGLALGRHDLPALSLIGPCPILFRAIWMARAWLRSEKRKRALVVYAETSAGTKRIFGSMSPTKDILSDGAVAVLLDETGPLILRGYGDAENDHWWKYFDELKGAAHDDELAAVRDSFSASKTALERCLEHAELTRENIAAMVMPNEVDMLVRYLARQTKIPVEKIFRCESAPSHAWAVDPIYNLDRLVASGRVSNGDLVMCISRTIGAAAALAVEIAR